MKHRNEKTALPVRVHPELPAHKIESARALSVPCAPPEDLCEVELTGLIPPFGRQHEVVGGKLKRPSAPGLLVYWAYWYLWSCETVVGWKIVVVG